MVAENSIETRVSASFIDDVHSVHDIIKIANSIMLDEARKFGDQRLKHVKLVQLMVSLGNVNHTASVVEKCIFY